MGLRIFEQGENMIIKTNDCVNRSVPQSVSVTPEVNSKFIGTSGAAENITGTNRDCFERTENAESIGAYSPETIRNSANTPETISATLR